MRMSSEENTDTDDEHYNKVLNAYTNKPPEYEKLLTEKMRKEKIVKKYRRPEVTRKSPSDQPHPSKMLPSDGSSPLFPEDTSNSDNKEVFLPMRLRSGRTRGQTRGPQPSTSSGGQAKNDVDSTTEESEYKLSGRSSKSSSDEDVAPSRRAVSRRKKKWQLKVRGKENKRSTPPESENNSDETVIIKTELEQDIQPGGESDSTTGYPSPSRVMIAEVHAPENHNSDGSVIVLD